MPDPTRSYAGPADAVATESGEATVPPAAGSDDLRFLASPERPEEIGRLSHYRVLGVLGRGGMGVVLRAEDTLLERPVALKVMLPQISVNAAARDRFLREARAAAAVKHDHIVTIYQVGEDRGVPFIALELLRGAPLDQWLAGNPRPAIAHAVRIGREVALGLAAAHDVGLIHRDIKPGNIWLEAPGDRVKLLDFGLARPAKDDLHLTASGQFVGTPAYMAPEQASGKTVDHRCDLFSLGVLLYRLCAGRLPFERGDLIATIAAIALEPPPPVRSLNPEIPAALAELIDRLLAKNPAERPASATEVAERLAAVERQLTNARPTTSLPRQPSRWPWLPAYVTIIVAATIVAAFMLFRNWDSKKQPGDLPKTVQSPPAAPVVVDLLAMVDPVRDGMKGQWEQRGRDLIGDGKSDNAVLDLPYRPPEEYDFVIEFTRKAFSSVGQYLALPEGRSCGWCMSVRRAYIHGFDTVDGKPLLDADHPARAEKPPLPRDLRITSRVEVRRTGLRALINGVVVAEFHGDFHRMQSSTPVSRDGSRLGLYTWSGPVEFHKVDVVELSGRGTLMLPTGDRGKVAPPPDTNAGAIDLLALADPALDAKIGKWERRGTDLIGAGPGPADKPGHAVLDLPYRPPEEYDFTIAYTRRGFAKVVQYLPLSGVRFGTWTMGGGTGQWVAFETIDGKLAYDEANPTRREVAWKDRRYTSRVEVRRDGLRALLDGEVIAEYRGDFARLDAPVFLRPRDRADLALALYAGPVEFHKAEVFEVSGKGTLTRPVSP